MDWSQLAWELPPKIRYSWNDIWKATRGRRRRRRRKQLLDDLNTKRGYWKLKEDALERILWRTDCGRGDGHAVRWTKE